MTATAVVDAQCGDTGKGKIIDYLIPILCIKFNCRTGGGENAGHTVVVEDEVIKFHLYPSGAMYPDVLNIIAPGVVVNPERLIKEIDSLEKGKHKINLLVSDNADVVFSWHKALDGAQEIRRGAKLIGTTKMGIGPAYMDTAGRTCTITMGELIDPDIFREKLDIVYPLKELELKAYGIGMQETKEEILQKASEWRARLKNYVGDTVYKINELIRKGENVLFEGAQGTLLDVRFGTRPYVTSSHPIAGGVCVGAGVSPKLIDSIIGVSKAYLTRVGEGPFPTELGSYEEIKNETQPEKEEEIEKVAKELLIRINNGKASDLEIGRYLRLKGGEYGTTTGRPRRTGYVDIPMVKYSHLINDFDKLAITKLDILSGLKEVKICTAYIIDGKETERFRPNSRELGKAEPVYETFDGWPEMTSKDWVPYVESGTLPYEAELYVDRIEELVDVPVLLASVGQERHQTVFLNH